MSDGGAFGYDGVALATGGQPKPKSMEPVTCYNRGEMGHYSYECTNSKKPAIVAVQATQVVAQPVAQTGKQMLMAGVHSGEFDSMRHHTSISGFYFLHNAQDARSDAGVTFNFGQDRPHPQDLDSARQPVDG